MSRLRFNNVVTPATPATGKTELFVDSSTKHLKSIDSDGLVRDFVATGAPLTTVAAPVATSGTGDTQIISLTIPANYATVGKTFRIWWSGITSAGGTVTFKIRTGATNTISDNVGWTSITSAAQAANQRLGGQCYLTVRAIGAGGNCNTDGLAYALNLNLNTAVGAAAVSNAATNATWYITFDASCATAGTWTIQNGAIDEIN